MLFRYLYWGQGGNNAGIFRVDLDGKNTIAIAASNVEQPTGMTFGEWRCLYHMLAVCVSSLDIVYLQHKRSTAYINEAAYFCYFVFLKDSGIKSWRKETSAPSLRTLVMEEERMRPVVDIAQLMSVL